MNAKNSATERVTYEIPLWAYDALNDSTDYEKLSELNRLDLDLFMRDNIVNKHFNSIPEKIVKVLSMAKNSINNKVTLSVQATFRKKINH